MKKILGIALSLFVVVFTFAQEGETGSGDNNPQIQNKKGVNIMPEAGEYAVGFNASNIINNVLANFGDNNGSFGAQSLFTDGASIMGKKMITDSKAWRVSFTTFSQNNRDRFEVQDDIGLDPDSVTYDARTIKSNNYTIALGQEFRRGKGRFRALYGGNVVAGISHGRWDYEYGNAMSASNTIPTTSTGLGTVYNNGGAGNERLIMRDLGRTINFGLRGFIGAEYFFAPKACIGGEFGLSANKSWTRDAVDKYEFFDVTNNEVVEKEDLANKSFGSRNFNVSVDDFNSWLYLMIYF